MKPFLLFLLAIPSLLTAQTDRWQQAANYEMDIDFDVKTHRFEGEQRITYTNNSPDTLYKVFYHLYFNAFQPNSMMDMRSRTIVDPDGRVGDRISKLLPDSMGYQKIKSLKQNGKNVRYEVVETILEVTLAEPIMPGSRTVFEMEFEAQVPEQIRRSGRNNAEGIAYSMSQWYPKLCEYDYQGWHANPYIGREFYGIWGDFDVKIEIDKDYIIGATGYLQNPDEIGYGYEAEGTKVKQKGKKLTWHFKAPKVHDFVWAADRDYTHTSLKRKDGMVMHFFYQKNEKTEAVWAALPAIMDRAFEFINKTFGQYPYQQYSFIQGGDGGMEYPMATLITGERGLSSLVGVSVHELMHSWYQMVLGTNESLYPWMDEGFTDYATNEVMNVLATEGLITGMRPQANPQARTYGGYMALVNGRIVLEEGKPAISEEALSTHADHYQTNTAYGIASYGKGSIFLSQLKYIIGKEAFDKGMLRYFHDWKFKHPNVNDFIRVMEKQSGLELDWYKEYWVNTTHTIDYTVEAVEEAKSGTTIKLKRIGLMPMPIDVLVTYANGSTELFNIPQTIMRGSKPNENLASKYTVLPGWHWTHPDYAFDLPVKRADITKVEIDPSGRMADTNSKNNAFPKN